MVRAPIPTFTHQLVVAWHDPKCLGGDSVSRFRDH